MLLGVRFSLQGVRTSNQSRHQLVWPDSGLLTMKSSGKTLACSDPFGVLVPRSTQHVTHSDGAVWVADFDAVSCPPEWRSVCQVRVGPAAASALQTLSVSSDAAWSSAALTAVVSHLHQQLCQPNVSLTFPTDSRALDVANALRLDPGNCADLEEWAARFATSVRTLRRLFMDETGLTFDVWRRKLRCEHAETLLLEGVSIRETSRRCGYATQASFTRVFRSELGVPPAQYLRSLGAEAREPDVWPLEDKAWPSRDKQPPHTVASEINREVLQGDDVNRKAAGVCMAGLMVLGACASESATSSGDAAPESAVTAAVSADEAEPTQETRTFVDDLERSVEVPVAPQSIASIDDLRITLPLIELGAPLTASHGRVSKVDGSNYIRGADTLTGANFDDQGIAFLGDSPIDIEALASASPDLIITLASRDAPLDQLEAIAPTVVFDEDATDRFTIYARLAELTGTEARLNTLNSRYEAQLAQLVRLVDTEAITISIIEGSDGTIAVEGTYGSLGRVVRDAGFQMPDIINELDPGTSAELSAELLPELDADVIFDTFRNDRAETPADADARMREVLDNYCEVLTACAEGQYYRIPRDEAKAISYNALSEAVVRLLTIMSSSVPVEG